MALFHRATIMVAALVLALGPASACLCPYYCTEEGTCGSDGRTYCNECLAKCATGSPPPAPVGPCCTTLANPVCGADKNDYSNACHASAVGGTKSSAGACTHSSDCICTREYNPVCNTATNITYGNPCEAKCDGVTTNTTEGACPVCACLSLVILPVCGKDLVTYSSPCMAACAGAVVQSKGPCATCTSLCPKGGKAVCGKKKAKYANICLLRCAEGASAVASTCK